MTGEMLAIDPITGREPSGVTWPLHAAIAKAVGGTVQPFDQYQGPYILIGKDVRIGSPPYAYLPPGAAIRLWVDSWDGVYGSVWREDTDTLSFEFPLEDTQAGIDAALELVGPPPPLVECGCCGEWHLDSFFGDCRDDDNRYIDEEDYAHRSGVPIDQVKLVFLPDEML